MVWVAFIGIAFNDWFMEGLVGISGKSFYFDEALGLLWLNFHFHRLLWFSIHLHRLLWFEIFSKLTWLRYIIFSVDFNEIQRSNFERHPLMKSCRTNYEIYWSVAKHSDRVKTILICLWLPNYNSMTADFITFI